MPSGRPVPPSQPSPDHIWPLCGGFRVCLLFWSLRGPWVELRCAAGRAMQGDAPGWEMELGGPKGGACGWGLHLHSGLSRCDSGN